MTQKEIAALITPFVQERKAAGAEYVTADEVYDWLYVKNPNILRTWEPGQIKAPDGIKKAVGLTMRNFLMLVNVQGSGRYRLRSTVEALRDS